MIKFKDLSKLNCFEKQRLIDWKSDSELSDKIMSIPVTLSLNELELWIQNNEKDQNQFCKSVHLIFDDHLIGLARLMFIDTEAKIAEVGLYIGDVKNRKGNYGTEILNSLITIAREIYDLNKLYARININNIGSIKLFEKFDFIIEGNLREHYFSKINDEYVTVLIMSKFIRG
jgi:RimJ/RimL family protein N-acetyltransferase